MSYRKFRASHLFTGEQWLGDGYVLITNEQGIIQEIVPVSAAGDGIEAHAGILSPGFVNCHCHLELSHLKGQVPPATGMVSFLLSVIRLRHFQTEQIVAAIAHAESAMLDNGIVAVGDICNTTHTLAQKQKGRLRYHNFIETIGFIESTASQRMHDSLHIANQFMALSAATSVVPHAPYSVSPALFQLVTGLPGNQLLTIHNQESEAENEFFEKGTGDFHRLYQGLGMDIAFHAATGKSSLQSYWPYISPHQSVILVHNTAIRESDLEFLASMVNGQWSMVNRESAIGNGSRLPTIGSRLSFCLCPNANQYIGNPLPNIDLLRRYQSNITIGTDSLASNNQLSIVAELQTIHRHYPHIELPELLSWATINGARALQMDDMLGSFEKGKQPGVVLVSDDVMSVKRLV
jgi:cytosine/adenosine deaminase-related metal-dependent hydrolase